MPKENNIKRVVILLRSIQVLIGLILVLFVLSIFSSDLEKYAAEASKRHAQEKVDQAKSDSLKIVLAKEIALKKEYSTFWQAKAISDVKDRSSSASITYGQELIAHTAKYFGPKGSIAQTTNGMNCQNCHLDAGTRPWGNNYGSVYATYPKYRARSGTQENISKRINDCFERSLNGKALDTTSKEIQAMKSYIEYIGSNVEKGEKAKASGIFELPFLNRAASPEKGKALYEAKCVVCHQQDGQGQLAQDGIEFTFPPLWGQKSYNAGAGLFRISRFAGYIKYNMPQGATYQNPQLTDEEAWDLAAFINTQPRPQKDLSKDWPKIAEKPADHPFGPYADAFSEAQHKFGPFQPIKDEQKKQKDLKEKHKTK